LTKQQRADLIRYGPAKDQDVEDKGQPLQLLKRPKHRVSLREYDLLLHKLEIEAQKIYYASMIREHRDKLSAADFKRMKNLYARYQLEAATNGLFPADQTG